MKSFPVSVSSSHLKNSNATAPVNAIKEAIWNSLDADSNLIRVQFLTRNMAEVTTIDQIQIIDDGDGLCYSKVEKSLEKVGFSNKPFQMVSTNGRPLHGKFGEGRYTYFSIGGEVSWESCYCENNQNFEYKINFGQANTKIECDEPRISDKHTGLIVRIGDIKEKSNKLITEKEQVISDLIETFAGYLLHYPNIRIMYDNSELDYKANIERNREKNFEVEGNEFSVKIIHWKQVKNIKKLFVCGLNDVVYHSHEIRPGEPISVYLSSSYFDDLKANVKLEAITADDNLSWDPTGIAGRMMEVANNYIKDYVKEVAVLKQNAVLEKMKEDGVYPFLKEVNGITDQRHREMFDILAVQLNELSPQTRSADTKVQKLTYKLLSSAISDRPENLKKILEEVYGLSNEKINQLAILLNKTSLSNIISSVQDATDRLTFLDTLHEIIYGTKASKMKERTEFQHLIEQQLWIFGDNYSYGTADISIKNLLIKYLNYLNREDLVGEIGGEGGDITLIPDICLFNKQRIGEKYENLVVELKRPNRPIGKEEFEQIKKYAYTIIDDPGADTEHSFWRFIIIGKDLTLDVKREMQDKIGGVYQELKKGGKIEVHTWSEIIEQNKLRYEYFKEKLELEITDSDVDEFMKSRWDEIRKTNENKQIRKKK